MRILRLAAALLLAVPPVAAGMSDLDRAMEMLGRSEFDGADEEFRRLAAQGEAQAAFMIGVMHESGFGRAADDVEARKWYAEAAAGGLASAQYNLAVFHQTGRGGPRDDAAALFWLRTAAAQGHARAQNNLATMYFAGAAVERDLVEAWKWQTLAAEGLTGAEREAARTNLATIEASLDRVERAEAEARVTAWREAR